MENVGGFFFFFTRRWKACSFLKKKKKKSIRPGRKPWVEVTQGKQKDVLNDLQRLLSTLMIQEGDLQTHRNWPQPSLGLLLSPTLANLLTSFTGAAPSRPILPTPPSLALQLEIFWPLALGLEGVAGTTEVRCAPACRATHTRGPEPVCFGDRTPIRMSLPPLV